MITINELIKELKGKEVTCKKLGEICNITLGKQLTKNMLKDNGVPVISSGEIPLGFTDKSNYEPPCVTIS